MAKSMINNRTDAYKTDVRLLNCKQLTVERYSYSRRDARGRGWGDYEESLQTDFTSPWYTV